jgi:hypothetical protein
MFTFEYSPSWIHMFQNVPVEIQKWFVNFNTKYVGELYKVNPETFYSGNQSFEKGIPNWQFIKQVETPCANHVYYSYAETKEGAMLDFFYEIL